MNVLDKLLGLSLSEDLTETTWWTDTIVRGLAEDWPEPQASELAVDGAETQQATEAT
jgi:hypothetical protein